MLKKLLQIVESVGAGQTECTQFRALVDRKFNLKITLNHTRKPKTSSKNVPKRFVKCSLTLEYFFLNCPNTMTVSIIRKIEMKTAIFMHFVAYVEGTKNATRNYQKLYRIVSVQKHS